MPSAKPRVVSIGEVLWDEFPDGSRLGGAAANVAFHAARLGAESLLVSRVGNDDQGRRALALLAGAGVDTSGVGIDEHAPTGFVRVTFEEGEPRFAIGHGVAWDRIDIQSKVAAHARTAGALCFGTLAQRTPLVRGCLRHFLEGVRASASGRVLGPGRPPRPVCLLDLNLRPPFDDAATIVGALATADVVKLNEKEAEWLSQAMGVQDPILWMFERFPIELVALTRGARGASLIGRVVTLHRDGIPTSGGDPVGAGDAFVASLACSLSSDESWPQALERANRHAAWVAGRAGAMPL